MTRRERAAMVLALEVLRFDTAYQGHCDDEATTDVHAACAAMREGARGRQSSRRLYAIVDAAIGVARTAYAADEGRLLRARLAFYLRARLRAEGREEVGFGRWACVDCGSGDLRHPWIEPGPRCRSCGGDGIDYTCRITPLWQQAPAHGHWRHRCTGGRPVDLPRGEECDECGARRTGRG